MKTRNKYFPFVAALLPILVAAEYPVRILEGLSMYSRILKQEVKYSVILPTEYFSSGKSFPVIYLFHGLGDNESSWLEYGRLSQFIDEERDAQHIVPAIYIMPQGFRSYYINDYLGKFKYEDMFIKEFIPYIDSAYRTIPDSRHRAIIGYSMGGFGSLVLPLKHPDVFSVSVPLSISVRTDSQYMTETPQEEWNQQWGRLFGGEGKLGKERITKHYKENSPFYLIGNRGKISDLKIYIDNGDDEQTLAISNEELHILMKDNEIQHEFRVRNGGHEFSYWREALPNALWFISDAFENKPYRGDQKPSSILLNETAINKEQLIRTSGCFVALPPEYNETTRLYPVLYFVGPFDTIQMKRISALIHELSVTPTIPPCILVFSNDMQNDLLTLTVKEMEKFFRIRPGKRFRALLAYDVGSSILIKNMQIPESFTAFVLSDARFTSFKENEAQITAEKQDLFLAWYYFDAPSNGNNYRFYGNLHIQFRKKEIYHEYRVREGNGGFEWFFEGLPEYIKYMTIKIHK